MVSSVAIIGDYFVPLIKLHYKDGNFTEYKNGYGELNASHLFEVIKDRFYVRDSYNFNPNLRKRMPIEELDYIKHGKKEYRINADNMRI